MKPKFPVPKVALPAAYDEEVLYAFRALFEGKANDGQQKRAMEWLCRNVCHVGVVSYGDTDRDTSFLEGQRSVAIQVLNLREAWALEMIKGFSKQTKQEANT